MNRVPSQLNEDTPLIRMLSMYRTQNYYPRNEGTSLINSIVNSISVDVHLHTTMFPNLLNIFRGTSLA